MLAKFKEPDIVAYLDYFDGYQPLCLAELQSRTESLKYHQISIDDRHTPEGSCRVQLTGIINLGSIVHYEVHIGAFCVKVVVLHNGIDYNLAEKEETPIDRGGFGKIYKKQVCTEEFVIKSVQFKQRKFSRV